MSRRRSQLLRDVIAAGAGGVGAGELAAHNGVTHPAVRAHLATLMSCGLVIARPLRPVGRGRPALRSVATTGAIWWGSGDPVEQLARLLAGEDRAAAVTGWGVTAPASARELGAA